MDAYGKTAGAIPDRLFAKINDLDISTGFAHTHSELVQQKPCFALAFGPGARIEGEYFHGILLSILSGNREDQDKVDAFNYFSNFSILSARLIILKDL